jgi:hypothetical protein
MMLGSGSLSCVMFAPHLVDSFYGPDIDGLRATAASGLPGAQ